MTIKDDLAEIHKIATDLAKQDVAAARRLRRVAERLARKMALVRRKAGEVRRILETLSPGKSK